MRSIGNVKIDTEEYVIMIIYQKSMTYYFLLSKYHKDDRKALLFGEELSHPERDIVSYAMSAFDENYLVASIWRKNIGREMKAYGSYRTLLDIIQTIQKATAYSFEKSQIIVNESEVLSESGELLHNFMAKDDSIFLEYRKCGGFVINLQYVSSFMEIKFASTDKYKFPSIKKLEHLMKPLNVEDVGSSLYYSNVKMIDYDDVLRSMPDSRWYCDVTPDGETIYFKDYRCIKTIEEFEREIILGLVREIKKARENNELPVLVSVDTETTGLNVYNIPSDLQSKVVAIPFSYKDNCGLTIFTDMEYFSNIPITYVKERLEPFLLKDITSDKEISIDTIEGVFTFRRSELFVTGHNTMFDIKALSVHNFNIWYDADTMQMSFNLDPFLTKRKNSLKYIIHKLFQCWTPELTDVLGKGNEDKFRYIQDERLAALYGGGDADFSRLVFKSIKELYIECRKFHKRDLFKTYLDQDVLLMNIFAKVDYEGVRINRQRFVEEGNKVKEDIRIITDFAHKYVGRVIAVNNYLYQLEVAKSSGISENTIPKPDLENTPPYEFEFAGNDLIKTLYSILHYPIFVWTEPPKSKDGEKKEAKPRPAVNKVAMKKLMSCTYNTPTSILKNDILGTDGKPLIKAEEFNLYKYPVAYLVSLIGPRKKEYDSYFKPFVEDSFEDRLCKDTKFSAIDTRRVSNPIQTIKGSLKKYILPHDDTYAMCDFDMSQVELRIMASLAHDQYMINRMKDPEVDSHTEVAADMFYKAAYLISKKERSYAKQINFGYPYGLMRFSMCEKIFGNTKDENLAKTQLLIETFEKVKHVVVTFLNQVRSNTLEPIEIPECLRNYLEIKDDIPVGIVRNLKGFYKLFQLDNLDEKKASRISRQAGNFPIQSFAAELFRIVLIRLYLAFYKEGWIQKDWIKWHMIVHDELLFSFKKKVIHPIHLIKLVQKSCTVSIEGHTNYYIGINIGNNWGDCKDDSSELPVYMVNRLVKQWDAGKFVHEEVDDPQQYMAKLRKEYIRDRIFEVVFEIYPNIKNIIDCSKILEKFQNYTVRKYIYECYPPLWSIADGEEIFNSYFASWALDYFGDNITFITSDGKKVILKSSLKALTKIKNGKEIPYSFEEMFQGVEVDFFDSDINLDFSSLQVEDDTYYDDINWDMDAKNNPYYIDYSVDVEETKFEDLFDTNLGNTFESMRKVSSQQFKNIEVTSTRVKIDLYRKSHAKQIDNLLIKEKLLSKTGLQIIYYSKLAIIKGGFIEKNDLEKLDNIVEKVRGENYGI